MRSISLNLEGEKGSRRMMEINKDVKVYHKTPIGFLEIAGSEKGISNVTFSGTVLNSEDEIPLPLRECVHQIEEYFSGKRKTFSLLLNVQGTDFQKRVWSELMKIPYGSTVSYKDIAASTGNEKATRAIGNANGKNRIAIIIPCHRVIAHNGTLGGFGGGLWRKEWLLNHEKKR
jgi:methylated-DNA-[protein]-cysteine S-methyltransferase